MNATWALIERDASPEWLADQKQAMRFSRVKRYVEEHGRYPDWWRSDE